MRNFIVFACSVLACLTLWGCEDQVSVISSDGDRTVAECGLTWTKCISDACPNGFIIVKQPTSSTFGILRCK